MSTPEENKSTAANFLLSPETILQSRYRIVRHLGKGGMGAVYEAIDLRLGHTVALKQTLTSDEELWKQFEREARLMARLNHPVLPRVSDNFTEGHRAVLVMQPAETAKFVRNTQTRTARLRGAIFPGSFPLRVRGTP